MPVYLYTVESCWRNARGLLTAERGIHLSEIKQRPQLKRLIQGIVLELRRPDGTARRTYLFNYGVAAVRSEDGLVLREEDPQLRFTLPGELDEADLPPGTEIWWLDDEPGLSREEISQKLSEYTSPEGPR